MVAVQRFIFRHETDHLAGILFTDRCDSGINSNFAENVLKVILTKFLHAEYGVVGGGLVSICEAEVSGAQS